MESGLKQRLVGAAALAALAVVFLPMVFDDTDVSLDVSDGAFIPPRPSELGGPQFAPLTEAEIKRGARLPPLPIAPTPADPGLSGDTGRPAKPPAAPTTAPAAAPRAVPLPSAKIRALAAPTARPATSPTDTARTRKDPPAGSSGTTWAIQLGSFTSEANAKKLRHRLQKLGFQPFVERITVKTQSVFRVRVGPERERQKAEALRAKIRKQANLDGILVRYP
ncbi:MAG: SPOR domain-containing protein [Beggiatoa sp.]|nr:SPOR domain-containing protein [Beggiatoa sp.]